MKHKETVYLASGHIYVVCGKTRNLIQSLGADPVSLKPQVHFLSQALFLRTPILKNYCEKEQSNVEKDMPKEILLNLRRK